MRPLPWVGLWRGDRSTAVHFNANEESLQHATRSQTRMTASDQKVSTRRAQALPRALPNLTAREGAVGLARGAPQSRARLRAEGKGGAVGQGRKPRYSTVDGIVNEQFPARPRRAGSLLFTLQLLMLGVLPALVGSPGCKRCGDDGVESWFFTAARWAAACGFVAQ